ncbi:hypothetical protein IFR05_012814 [Cadophora sp. M221]|nr:hypothetical protein IFR05_012814 [Cadophora sp. M221]
MEDYSDLPPLATTNVPLGDLLLIHEKTLGNIATLENGNQDFESLPGMPNITPVMVRLFRAMRSRQIRGLAEELYKMNAERLKLFQEDGAIYNDANEHNILSALERLEEDRKASHVMYKLLLTLDMRVIESLIANSLGYAYERDGDFRNKFSPVKNSAGVYVLTLVPRDDAATRGLGLRRHDLMTLRNQIERYFKWSRRCIPEDEDDPEYDEIMRESKAAAEIEWRYHRSHESLADVFQYTSRGGRSMSSPGCFQLLEVLNKYVGFAFDPDNEPLLRQSLMFVGSSFSMSRMLDNVGGIPPSSYAGLYNSEPLSLILGCLGCKDTNIVPIVIPVLRIWGRDQLQIAQDTLGWLTGAHGVVNLTDKEVSCLSELAQADAMMAESFETVKKELERENGCYNRNELLEYQGRLVERSYFSFVDMSEDDRDAEIEATRKKIENYRSQEAKAKAALDRAQVIITGISGLLGRQIVWESRLGLLEILRSHEKQACELQELWVGSIRDHSITEASLGLLTSIKESSQALLDFFEVHDYPGRAAEKAIHPLSTLPEGFILALANL